MSLLHPPRHKDTHHLRSSLTAIRESPLSLKIRWCIVITNKVPLPRWSLTVIREFRLSLRWCIATISKGQLIEWILEFLSMEIKRAI